MAIDTAAKRKSAVNVMCPWRAALPFPDGTIAAGDRQVVAFLYSGILAGSVVQSVPSLCLDLPHRSLTLDLPRRSTVLSLPERSKTLDLPWKP